jgi:hypothetical protein
VSGLPVDRLLDLVSPVAFQEARRILSTRSELEREAEALSGTLYDLVPKQTRGGRRRLLRLRRDLYNLRTPAARDMESIGEEMLFGRVAGFAGRLEALEALEAGFRETYAAEVAELRDRLRRGLADADFGAGLRLSSRSLARRLKAFFEDPGTPLDPKAERGLLRYLSRAAGKATPFGRFCTILPGRIAEGEEPMTLAGDPGRKWSRIRLNKRLMRPVLGRLAKDEVIRLQLPLRLNPTLDVTSEEVTFLAAFSGREAFQAVARNPAVDLVVATLRQGDGGTVRDLARAISRLDEVEATHEEAEAYLERFVEMGMLQLDFPGLGHDPDWAGCLLRSLERVPDGPVIQEVRAFLRNLARRTEELQRRGIGLGGELVEELEAFVRRTLESWFDDPPEPHRPLVYEDASAQGHARIDLGHFRSALGSLEALLRLLAPVAWIRVEPFVMRRFYEERFGDVRVPLLTFYEVYYREHVKPRERAKARGAKRPRERGEEAGEAGSAETEEKGAHREPPPGVAAIKEAHKRLRALVRERWIRNPRAREIVLRPSDLEKATRDVPSLPPEPRSFSAFLTWVPDSRKTDGGLVVLPNARGQAGYGKYFSRFLYLLPQEVLEAVRAGHGDCGDLVLAEIAGDAAFNANLRPPIRSCEIVYPTGDRVGCPEALEVGDLEVGLGEEGAGLRLYQRGTDRRVLPVDLGFLNPMARPPLYQLLRRFSPSSEAYLDLPLEPGPELSGNGPVLHRPRISFEGRVVLAREAWIVPASELPVRQREEEEAAFYLRVVAWSRRLELPERAYVKAVRRSDGGPRQGGRKEEEEKEEKAENGGEARRGGKGPSAGDLRKPQYMDLRSPLLVGLLRRYGRLGEGFALVFEECLPAAEDLPTGPEGRRWVTESILQADMSAEAGQEARGFREQEAAHV